MQHIQVRTRRFPTDPEGDLVLCNGQPGSAFATWLRDGLREQGYPGGEPIQEDYGWGFWIEQDGCSLWVCVSWMPDEGPDRAASGNDEPDWVVSVAHDFPFFAIRQWFRRAAGRRLVDDLHAAVRRLIASCADIREVAESGL